MEYNKTTIAIGLIAIMVIFLVIYALPGVLKDNASDVCVIDGECQHEQDYEFIVNLTPFFIGLGFIFGIIAFYLFFNKKAEKKKIETGVLLALLNNDERKIISKIIEKKGEVIQTSLSRIEGLGKVKAHRLIKKLEKRGVVEIEPYGKTNLIKLNNRIKEGLF